ncbi:M48 family metallopeptidase [Hellea balneolensis]|uniref:M48 family metallopeptidase n=1 Tax=Hellea balneolensis TaxID=287478 RepID=UPI0004127295|nr:M48 family metallopeptidase [Hellea balneolensis]
MRIILSALVLGGCASVSTQLPDITAPQLSDEQARQEVLAFEDLGQQQHRLMQVALPVLKANTELCPKTREDIGVVMHNLKTYPKDLRPAAMRELGAKEEPSVRLVVTGSPAEMAGLKAGDQFLTAKDKITTPTAKVIQDSLKAGEDIQIRRGGKKMDFSIKSETICGYTVRLSQTSTINAYADGRNITMTTGMMNFVKNDDELALIVGHELGHNTMGHIRKVVSNIILSLGGTRYTRPFESESDYVGLYYMVRAGYNPDGVEEFWRRLAVTNPKHVARAKTHPTYPNRYLSIAAAREEIKAKQAAGKPLIPNFKTKDKKS